MALEGNLRDFSATEILQLAASQRKTGCLLVEHRTRRMSVHVVEGRIVSTRVPGPLDDDPLYQFLRRVRRLSEDQLRGIASLQAASRRDLEDLIVEGRYLEVEDLGVLIERQVLDDMTELIEWTEGRYQFDPDRRWPHPILVRLSIEASLIEAARRADERKRFQELFRDGRQLVSVRDLPDPEEEIADEESELFGIIDGQHTVAEVISQAPLSDYEANEALQRMIEAGWVEFIGRRESGPAPVTAADGAPTPAARSAAPPARDAGVRPGMPVLRETVAAALSLGAIAALWVLAHRLPAAPRMDIATSVYTAAQIRDVRLALEVYRREQGRYPERLEELANGGWVERGWLSIDGRPLHYRLDPPSGRYLLEPPTD